MATAPADTVTSHPVTPGEAAPDQAAPALSQSAKKAASRAREAKKERGRPRWLTSRAAATDEAAASIVRNWLTLAGQPVTEQQITKLTRHARHWQPAARRAAVALVAEGTTPTPRRVRERTHRSVTGGPRGQTPAEVAAITHLGARAAQAAGWVADHHDRHGHGPTWAELSDAFDLTGYGHRARTAAIRAISRDGWLTHDPTPRSLRPGHRHRTDDPAATDDDRTATDG